MNIDLILLVKVAVKDKITGYAVKFLADFISEDENQIKSWKQRGFKTCISL